MTNKIIDIVASNSVVWIIALGYFYSLHGFASLGF